MSINIEGQVSAQIDTKQVLAAVDVTVGDTVRCYKDDPADGDYGIALDKRWHVGETFIVTKVKETPWGIFLHDDSGHNLNIIRAELVSSVNCR